MKANEMKNRNKLNMEELEMVNGGFDWKNALSFGGVFGAIGAAAGALFAIATGPVGWAAIAGTAAVTGAVTAASSGAAAGVYMEGK